MKKLYRKGTVHPTPSVVSDHLLSFLPAAILTLTAALSPGDKEVLAYLIYSCSSASFSNNHRKTTQKTAAGGGSKVGDDHAPCFSCNCFRCYMSYWIKWDSSPNRQLIHEIIDAFEDSLLKESKKEKNKKERRKGKSVKANITSLGLDEAKKSELSLSKEELNSAESNTAAEDGGGAGDIGGGGEEEDDNLEEEEEEELEKGSVRRFVSFLGERIWSVWG
ncbi:hypothetical protein BUALT_Bualt03G0082800 [Buddleja alternifolia]|uniref:Uncharacterized protein n=1 Tax=Buddleja alternifolia TaxID=168488 RepID=A0AAV6XS49_9LAMI|nr:hypothetical protein BUALT_Bualt03G0082800 [Buddleja alternifolia]